MTNTTTRQSNPITISSIISLFVVLVWGAFVIGGPLTMATMVYIPTGKIGLAIGNIGLAAIMSAPWCVFGLPVVRRFVSSLAN